MIFKLNDTSLPAIMGYNNEKEGEFVGSKLHIAKCLHRTLIQPTIIQDPLGACIGFLQIKKKKKNLLWLVLFYIYSLASFIQAITYVELWEYTRRQHHNVAFLHITRLPLFV